MPKDLSKPGRRARAVERAVERAGSVPGCTAGNAVLARTRGPSGIAKALLRTIAAVVLATAMAGSFAPEAHAFEDASASMGVTLSPLYENGQALPDGAAESTEGTAASEAADASESSVAALPRTGDGLGLVVGSLAAAALAAGAVLAFAWRCARGGQRQAKSAVSSEKEAPQPAEDAHCREEGAPRRADSPPRRAASSVMGVLLAACLALGSVPTALATEAETIGTDATQTAREPVSKDGKPAAPAEPENAEEATTSKASEELATPVEVAPGTKVSSVGDGSAAEASIAPLSTRARDWKYDDWGDYTYEIIGWPVIGTQMTLKFTPGPEIQADKTVVPYIEWYYAPGDGSVVFFGTGPTITVPEEGLKGQMHARVKDKNDQVGLWIVFAMSHIGYEFPGSVSVSGAPEVGSTLTAVPSGTPANADLSYGWYASSTPNGDKTLVSESKSLKLTSSYKGKYLEARVFDSSHYYGGYLSKIVGPVTQRQVPNAPELTETRLLPDGTVTATCRTAATAQRPTTHVALEYLGLDGSWVEADRKDASSPRAPCEVSLSASAAAVLESKGSVRVRAVAYNDVGASSPSAERTVTAQIGVTVPLAMRCTVASDGDVSSETQLVQNTGTLNAAIERIETAPAEGVAASGTWTCSSGGTLLYEGTFGESAAAAAELAIAPGESLPLAWSANGLDFGKLDVSGTPTRYGSVTYVVSPALE